MVPLLLVTILGYTVPRTQAPLGCDSTLSGWAPEVMGSIEVWYGPRFGAYRLLRTKPVAGLEGTRDTVQVPDDSLASIYLVPVDAAGNRGCESRSVTVGGRVGVQDWPQSPDRDIWYDVLGRRLDGRPGRSGVYWRVKRSGHRQLVVVR